MTTTSQRVVRSKALRNALWIAAAGHCQQCGCDLPPEWHADHVIPWKVTHQTNVHEMHAVCPSCNLKKGATSMILRRHQHAFDELCQKILAGTYPALRHLIISVTPGGGKSRLPVLLAARLIPAKAEALCWVVPRLSLQRQAEREFLKADLTPLVPHACTIRSSTNEVNPCRGRTGYVTTYQAIGSDEAGINAAEFQRRRYLLVLDEPHHVEDGGPWHRALQPLVDRAVLTVFMSGTLERGDGQRIAFLPYEETVTDTGVIVRPCLTPTDETAVIRYTRSDALAERAIIPLHFQHMDGSAEWLDHTGTSCAIESLAQAGEETGEALYTALHTAYAHQLLDRCVDDWISYQQFHSRSKLLVVAAKIPQAKTLVHRLYAKGLRAGLATSDDSMQAQEAIERFGRHGADCLDVLVTVAMAYEGLDNPSITHLACLTHIRSKPWIEQMLARVNRVDRHAGPYDDQYGYIYAPDDVLFNRCIAELRAEQEPFLRERVLSGEEDPPLRRSALQAERSIVPLVSSVTRERTSDLHSGEVVAYEETSSIVTAMREYGLTGSPLQFKRAVSALGYGALSREVAYGEAGEMTDREELLVTPTQREERLRKTIEQYCRRWDLCHGWDLGTRNKSVVAAFGKSRSEMTLEELTQVWRWLHDISPGDGGTNE